LTLVIDMPHCRDRVTEIALEHARMENLNEPSGPCPKHDDSVATLSEVIKIMARVQLGVTLSDTDTADIASFLRAPAANFAAAATLPPG
jgi:hypothetical protein